MRTDAAFYYRRDRFQAAILKSTVELYDDNAGLVFGVVSQVTAIQPPQQPQTPDRETPQEKPAVQQDQPIELVVTGEQDRYNVPDATTESDLRSLPPGSNCV